MNLLLKAAAVSAVLFAGAALAQSQYLDLSGRYRCVTNCLTGQPNQFAYITQSGLEMNIVNDAGMPSRAWMDRPGRFWIERANMGAIYSPDGVTIQFDNGTVWQRDVGLPEPAVPAPRTTTRTRPPNVAARPPARPTVTNAYDGGWSVRIVTQAGPCDPEYRFGAQIANGSVVYDGGGAINVQGQVVSDGRIWVNVSSGSQVASGEGRLSESVGSGNWRGQGPGGACAGVWQAVRRS
jgi:hypothetical protein